jgi:ligand-binding sensor domain-containing protein
MTPYSTESGLVSHEIYPLMQSCDGAVWIGSAQGLNRVRFRDGKIENSAIIVGANIQALWEDAAGRIWIGTTAGLRRYENGKILDLPALVNKATVHDVKADREGNYWVATHLGLFKFDGDNPLARYTTKDGLPSDDVNIIHQDRHGTLWFGDPGRIGTSQGRQVHFLHGG